MADLKDVVAINLLRLRHANGWTQEELADRAGITARYLGQVERGQASMSVTVLGRLANALTVDPAELLKATAAVETGTPSKAPGKQPAP